MRISELLVENQFFNDENFVTRTEAGRELNYDLAEDLVYFMNNNDDVYRRHLYPSVSVCLDKISAGRPTNPSLFRDAVINSYADYSRRYPIRELPRSLDEEMCNEICTKIHEEIKQHVSDGKYKD